MSLILSKWGLALLNMVKTNFVKKLPAATKETVIAVPMRESDLGFDLLSDDQVLASFRHLDFAKLGATGKFGSLTLIPFGESSSHAGATLALLGVGEGEDSSIDWRALGGCLTRGLGRFTRISVLATSLETKSVLELAEGFALSDYNYNKYKSVRQTKTPAKALTIVTSSKISAASLERIDILVRCVHETRDLVNQPPNHLYPETFVKEVQRGIKGLGIKIQAWDDKALDAEGFGGIAAVGRGSARPPRLVKISYEPKGAKRHLAFVGKGITFDSGGLSLKSGEAMVGMKYDMAGAASVYQAVVGIAKLGLKVHATAWLCLAENLPSGSATRPNDVIKIRNGKTVEVLNTDAEGRLVLADGLSAASEEHPDLLIDVATLTGAATVALGNRYAGLMGDDAPVLQIESAAKLAGELVWHMPLAQELRSLLDSDTADIANTKIGNRVGGMLLGGLFLREFVGPATPKSKSTIPWAHLDIAGPAENDSAPYGYTPTGGTGAIVRTLVTLAEQVAEA